MRPHCRPLCLAGLMILVAHSSVAMASPADVINDFWDNQSDQVLDKPHSWADLNGARSRFRELGYLPADVTQFSREVDRVIAQDKLGIDDPDYVSGLTDSGRVPLWVTLCAVVAAVVLAAGLVASIMRRRLRARSAGGGSQVT